MDSIADFFRSLYSTEGLIAIIRTGGLLALVAIVFAETGLLIGFFLPGDSLLVTAGILSSPHAVGGGIFDPFVLIVCLCLAAIAGDQVNFALGWKAGHLVFDRPDGRFIKRRHFHEAHAFYVARGGSAIVIARFAPILRTFVPFVAGVAEMPYRRFVGFNILGGMLWVVSLISLGHFLGGTPLGAKLHTVILVVVAVSLIPLVVGAYKVWRQQQRDAVK
ncbi:MAG TPA: VTT domain-containing protein [Gemmatimonadales bacterium]